VTGDSVEAAVAALRAGEVVVLPTDTVYGLCADGYRSGAAGRLAALKGRPDGMPVALLAADLETILECVPELRGSAAATARALLPGPFTLVLHNPARRFPWLTGEHPDTIGIRIPELPAESRAVLKRAGAVAATSANLHGGPDPRRIADIPEELLAAVAAVVDAGELPGTPSTVVDVTGPEPVVLREGAVPAAETLRRIAETLL
jgi:L-threonylcarbamoyladenylate synthase